MPYLVPPSLGSKVDGRGEAVVGPVSGFLLLDGEPLGNGFVVNCLVRQRPHGQTVRVPAILTLLQHRHLIHSPVRIIDHILKKNILLVSSRSWGKTFVSQRSCLWFYLKALSKAAQHPASDTAKACLLLP